MARFPHRFDFTLHYKLGHTDVVADALNCQETTISIATTSVTIGRHCGRHQVSILDRPSSQTTFAIDRDWRNPLFLGRRGHDICRWPASICPRWGVASTTSPRSTRCTSHRTSWAAAMLTLLVGNYYWPGMERDVEMYMCTCLTCQ